MTWPISSTVFSYFSVKTDRDCPDSSQLIGELLTTLDETPVYSLLFHAARLQEIGNRIDEISPIEFMRIMLRDSALRKHMLAVLQDSVKRFAFMQGNGLRDGFGQRLEIVENLQQEMEELVDEFGLERADIMPFLQMREWVDLLIHLIGKIDAQILDKSPV